MAQPLAPRLLPFPPPRVAVRPHSPPRLRKGRPYTAPWHLGAVALCRVALRAGWSDRPEGGRPLRVVIVGGGPGGLALARGLTGLPGLEITILEGRPEVKTGRRPIDGLVKRYTKLTSLRAC